MLFKMFVRYCVRLVSVLIMITDVLHHAGFCDAKIVPMFALFISANIYHVKR